MRHILVFLSGLAFLGSLSLSSAENAAIEKKPLTSIGAVSSLDAPPDPFDPGMGGGFDQTSYFQNRFIPNLADCTDNIANVFETWSHTKKLILPLREVALGTILIHATNSMLPGIFEMSYSVEPDKERARTSVYYFKKDGTKLDPALIKEILETWEIAALQDKLDAALKCGQS